MSTHTPVVLVSCNRIDNLHGTPGHVVRETYIRALTDVARCTPLLMPAVGASFDVRDILSRVDGVLLTGATRHLAPARYGARQEFPDDQLDLARDDTVMPIIEAALKIDMPLLGVCRGFQELNVICGGTLHQDVAALPGKHNHRVNPEMPITENYVRNTHPAHTQKGGLFEAWGMPAEFTVNTLHAQGIDELGRDLHIEALSDDGLIEAVSVKGRRFAVGVQWHPEGSYTVNPTDARLFEEFGKILHAAGTASAGLRATR
jgi:putative glutamine amidotransferase